MQTRVLIIDQHPLCRSALTELLCTHVGIPSSEVVECDSPTEALARIGELRPQLAICDVLTCGILGTGWPSRFVEASSPGAVLVFDHDYDSRTCEMAREAGARGYVARTSSMPVLAAATGLILAGETYFQPRSPGGKEGPGDRHVAQLSPRQSQVLVELERGQTNKEIAARLGISVATVKLHVQAILKATGAKNRTGAAALARTRR